jgi:hypothetical protein
LIERVITKRKADILTARWDGVRLTVFRELYTGDRQSIQLSPEEMLGIVTFIKEISKDAGS